MKADLEKPMSTAVQEQNVLADPHKCGADPGPALLPGIEGFYMLTAAGKLGRYRSNGSFIEEPALDEHLGDWTEALLARYRRGELEEAAIGLVTRRAPDSPWQCASLVFSDNALRAVYRTDDDPGAPLTAFQERNRVKSVYRGMSWTLVRDSGCW
jgi:hypothetical protein